jgi:serpin B
LSNFKGELQSIYSANIATVNFSKASAAREINNWIMEKTHGKIKDLLHEEPMPGVLLALVNAVYFKGNYVGIFVKLWYLISMSSIMLLLF